MAAGVQTNTPPPAAPLWQPYRITPRAGAQHVALDGEWQLGWRDAAIGGPGELGAITNWFGASVPSSVQWALHRAGKLPHPYEHLNSKEYEWVDEQAWYYRRTVELPETGDDSLVFLCFDGIDYFARVWFNGELLGRHEGMFGGPAIEVGRLVKRGVANEVVVEVRAGNHGNKKGWKPRGPEGAVIKPWVIAGGTGGEMFFPLGMWRGARVEIVPRDHIERPFLVTEEANDKEARLSLGIEAFAGTNSLQVSLHPWKNTQLVDASRGWSAGERCGAQFALRVRLAEKGGGSPAFERTFPLQLSAGRNFVKRDFTIANPKLWWPNGMGEPSLYRAEVTLMRDGGAADAIEFDCGIRTIRTSPTPGPRTADRWADWQFAVNGRPFFVKGVNWMPADILLDLPRERYAWLIGAARAAGIQMFRIWGGGLIETEEFFEACSESGILVWQDFPIGNRDTPEWPQEVWEAQVMQTIFRLRNHPSLALWCGGNEFNPYSLGNAATIGVLERCLADFDPTRPFRRTSPDHGSIHTYPDMDPTWYAPLYRQVPFIAETGMHNIPDPGNFREVVDAAELDRPFSGMLDKEFPRQHPDLMHHFVEFQASRVPRMLSRASHIDDMASPTIEALAEGTQVGAGEFYQVFSEQMQANWPVTSGLLPWVFKRPWPVIAIMLVDAAGHPTAPYYFLKRTYEPTHILAELPQLFWARGESVPVVAKVTHALAGGCEGMTVSAAILDRGFRERWRREAKASLAAGPSVASADLGAFALPEDFEDTFFFVVAELRDSGGGLVSRSVYWPRCLKQMADPAFARKYRASPQPTLALDKGPWLKRQVAAQATRIEVALEGHRRIADDRSVVAVKVRNAGERPAFPVCADVTGARRSCYANDNWFWLAPGEERRIELQVLWREPGGAAKASVSVGAWNAAAVVLEVR